MRSLLLALLLAAPGARDTAAAQEAAASTSEPAVAAAEAAEAADPVEAWQADKTAVFEAGTLDLDAFEYVARPLVIFADSPRQPQVAEQLRLIEAEAATLAERDVVVILDTDPEGRSAVRQALRPRGFGLVLVDKDGRVTFRRPAPMSVREIAHTIDRTPIRLEELRQGSGAQPAEE